METVYGVYYYARNLNKRYIAKTSNKEHIFTFLLLCSVMILDNE